MEVDGVAVASLSLGACITYLGKGDKALKKASPEDTPTAIRAALVARAEALLPGESGIRATPVSGRRGEYDLINRAAANGALEVGLQHQVEATAHTPNPLSRLTPSTKPLSAQAINQMSNAVLENEPLVAKALQDRNRLVRQGFDDAKPKPASASKGQAPSPTEKAVSTAQTTPKHSAKKQKEPKEASGSEGQVPLPVVSTASTAQTPPTVLAKRQEEQLKPASGSKGQASLPVVNAVSTTQTTPKAPAKKQEERQPASASKGQASSSASTAQTTPKAPAKKQEVEPKPKGQFPLPMGKALSMTQIVPKQPTNAPAKKQEEPDSEAPPSPERPA